MSHPSGTSLHSLSPSFRPNVQSVQRTIPYANSQPLKFLIPALPFFQSYVQLLFFPFISTTFNKVDEILFLDSRKKYQMEMPHLLPPIHLWVANLRSPQALSSSPLDRHHLSSISSLPYEAPANLFSNLPLFPVPPSPQSMTLSHPQPQRERDG